MGGTVTTANLSLSQAILHKSVVGTCLYDSGPPDLCGVFFSEK